MKKQIYNPFLPLDEYIPDGEPHVFGDRVYLYGSHDQEGGTEYCMLDYVCYSAPVNDLTDWRFEGEIYKAVQDPDYTENARMYAPDAVCGNDGRYYLYYHLQTAMGPSQPISVAVCDEPAGKYEFHGYVKNSEGTRYTKYLTGDPGVINDDGVIRLYHGWSLSSIAAEAHGRSPEDIPEEFRSINQVDPKERMIQAQMAFFKKTRDDIITPPGVMGANVVVLADDMLTVIDGPHRIVPGEYEAQGTSFEGHAFYEASSIRKVDDIYYFIYSSQWSHELCYATSRYPDRDFVYGGTIISNGDIGINGRERKDRLNMTANNHGSIEQINGQWYVFYHRQTHNSTFSRQACAERITILPDGSIPQVEITSCGLNGGPLRAEGDYPAAIACNITNGNMPHITNRVLGADIPFVTHKNDERFITNIKDGTMIGFKYFAFTGATRLSVKTRDNGEGHFEVHIEGHIVGEIPINPSDTWQESGIEIDTTGEAGLLLNYFGTGSIDLLSISMR